jgi:hypothetical protein
MQPSALQRQVVPERWASACKAFYTYLGKGTYIAIDEKRHQCAQKCSDSNLTCMPGFGNGQVYASLCNNPFRSEYTSRVAELKVPPSHNGLKTTRI